MIITEHNATLTNHHVDDHLDVVFDQFRKNFPYTKVNVQDGYMNYTIKRIEQARSIKEEADKTITRLKLSLKTTLKIMQYNAVLTIEPK